MASLAMSSVGTCIGIGDSPAKVFKKCHGFKVVGMDAWSMWTGLSSGALTSPDSPRMAEVVKGKPFGDRADEVFVRETVSQSAGLERSVVVAVDRRHPQPAVIGDHHFVEEAFFHRPLRGEGVQVPRCPVVLATNLTRHTRRFASVDRTGTVSHINPFPVGRAPGCFRSAGVPHKYRAVRHGRV